MTLSIFDTPIAERLPLPTRRSDAWNPALEEALYSAPGRDALIARVRAPGALVVTTGQQPGLLTGPSYAVSKALSARGVAAELERRWGTPVVPVYWVPGDDHDFDEVASVRWLGWDGTLLQASLEPRPADGPQVPMYRQPLGRGIADVLDAFGRSFPEGPPANEVLAWLRLHYRPEQPVASAYGEALADLLTPLGVLVLDGSHRAVKAAAAPFLLRALEGAGWLDRQLAQKARDLEAEGRGTSVPVGDGASLVFLDGPEGRDRLVESGGGFITRRGKARYRLDQLRAISSAEPERLSGNVLLRPVLESAVLPTVGYCAGPGELRYLDLARPVYEVLGVHRQPALPRWSGALVEPRVTRILEKLKTTVEELRGEGNALEQRLAREALPPGTQATFDSLRDAINSSYAAVIATSRTVDPNLDRPATSARGQTLHLADKLEKKLLRHAMHRESVTLSQVTLARTSLRPTGKPQERVLSMAGFMARHGTGLVADLARHIEGWYARALEATPQTP